MLPAGGFLLRFTSVLAVIAMEPPVGSGLDRGREKKVDVFRAMPEADPSMYVRDQYEGYLQIPRVKPASATENVRSRGAGTGLHTARRAIGFRGKLLSCIGRDRVHSASATPASTW
jgi:Glucose-6-phosphate 1-dehydrogenase